IVPNRQRLCRMTMSLFNNWFARNNWFL
ncbi:hypothetical protein A2U01_0101821, partial [Trifolium medium]|nr:hypothetical protein [Trifolium medium]